MSNFDYTHTSLWDRCIDALWVQLKSTRLQLRELHHSKIYLQNDVNVLTGFTNIFILYSYTVIRRWEFLCNIVVQIWHTDGERVLRSDAT